MIRARHLAGTSLIFFGSGISAFAQASEASPARIDSGDTAWVLTSAALVLMMTIPGLAFFYGGLVRVKNVLATLMQSFFMVGIITLQWVLIGYSLGFAPGGSLLGSLDWLGLQGVGLTPNPDYAATIPHQAFMIFQMMFAVITPALMTGAFAERMKFSAFVVFSLVWATLIYDPLAHWVWGTGGWLRNLGALDFAGGTVVHISSGVSALVAILIIGKGRVSERFPRSPHNLPFAVLGAACCGLAGLDSTRDRHWEPMDWQRTRLSSHILPRPRNARMGSGGVDGFG